MKSKFPVILIKFFLLFQISSYSQSWSQLGSDIDGEAGGDRSGCAVSLSGDGRVLTIGAYANEDNGFEAGQVRVYSWNGSAWVQKGGDIDGEAAGDQFGYSVNLSDDGNIFAAGGIRNDGSASNAGHVRVYEWNGSAWAQKGADLNGEATGDNFGYSVSLSGDGTTLAVGAPLNAGGGTGAGHVRIFKWNGSSWQQSGSDLNGEAAGDNFGTSVSLNSDGSNLAVGAPYNAAGGFSAGHVRVYSFNGSSWTQIGADIDGDATFQTFGKSVSLIDGNTLAVGAPEINGTVSNNGRVRIYSFVSSSWSQKGSDLLGESANDRFGVSVSMSDDGNTLAVGASRNSGNGTWSGHVRLFDCDGSGCIQHGGDLNGEAANDESGKSVSLSGNGSVLAVGAELNDGTAIGAGHVRLYSDGTVGIAQNNFGHELTIFPNPTQGEVVVHFKKVYSDVTLTIRNLSGKVIAKNYFPQTDVIKNTIYGPGGLYLLEITAGSKSAVLSVIKE